MVASFYNLLPFFVFKVNDYNMSKEVRPCIWIDENVSSVKIARDRVERAWFTQKDLKAELWGLIMATPKDITAEGEDPIGNLKERFEDIWDSLWEAFIDDYKYTVVVDDVELNEDSLVKKAWEEEEKSIEEMKREQKERNAFFDKFRGVLTPYNFDDHRLYEEFKAGNITINEPFTSEQRAWLINKIKERDKQEIKEAIERINKNGE